MVVGRDKAVWKYIVVAKTNKLFLMWKVELKIYVNNFLMHFSDFFVLNLNEAYDIFQYSTLLV